MTKKARISTFSKTLSLEQAEKEKSKDTSLGKTLKSADTLYQKKRKK